MTFRIYECLTNKSNLHIIKDYKTEGVTKKFEGVSKPVLGEIEGIFFVPDGVSANQRYYPKKFWEHVLSTDDVKSKLERKIMFGRIGHEDRDVTEDDVNSGKMSHIITELYIDKDGNGMGKAIILDTDAGRNLYACLAAGSDLRISSRASGDYKPNEYYGADNIPVMDETAYVLDTFDMVINPGFIETNPKLVTENCHKTKQPEHTGSTKCNEGTAQKKRRNNMPGSENHSKLIAEAKKRISAQRKRAEQAESRLAETKARYEKLLKAAKKIKAENADIKAKHSKAEAELTSFRKIAKTPKGLQEQLNKIGKTLEVGKKFKTEALEGRRYKAALEKAVPVLKAYTSTGSIQEVKSKLNKFESTRKEQAGKIIAEKVQHYSRKTGLQREAIRKVFSGAKDYKSAIAVLESLPAKKDASLYSKQNESVKKPAKAKHENVRVSGAGSIAARIVESRSKDFHEMSYANPEVGDAQ